jgi:hypothetical protein
VSDAGTWARTLISLALLTLAGLLFWQGTEAGHSLAPTIVGAIIGYWFSHAERAATNGGSK